MFAITPPATPRTAFRRPCPTSWGERRIFEDRTGEGLVPAAYPDRLGVGVGIARIA